MCIRGEPNKLAKGPALTSPSTPLASSSLSWRALRAYAPGRFREHVGILSHYATLDLHPRMTMAWAPRP
jgi:hypothetical protein